MNLNYFQFYFKNVKKDEVTVYNDKTRRMLIKHDMQIEFSPQIYQLGSSISYKI